MWSWKITYTQENPYSDTPRTRLTPGAASREVTIGYVIWSSISVGLRPDHSVKTIACTSDRSGIASSGTSKTAHTPPAVSNSTPRITRTGLRALFSMSRVIIFSHPMLSPSHPQPAQAGCFSRGPRAPRRPLFPVTCLLQPRLTETFRRSEEDPGASRWPLPPTCLPCRAGLSLHTSRLWRSEEHTSELQSRLHLVCRLLL